MTTDPDGANPPQIVCNICEAPATDTSLNGFGYPIPRCAECMPVRKLSGLISVESECPCCRGTGRITTSTYGPSR